MIEIRDRYMITENIIRYNCKKFISYRFISSKQDKIYIYSILILIIIILEYFKYKNIIRTFLSFKYRNLFTLFIHHADTFIIIIY